jgi:hypothetical protein
MYYFTSHISLISIFTAKRSSNLVKLLSFRISECNVSSTLNYSARMSLLSRDLQLFNSSKAVSKQKELG